MTKFRTKLITCLFICFSPVLFAQGDGSDGDLTLFGWLYTDAIRTTLSSGASSGASAISVNSTTGFVAGQQILIIDVYKSGGANFEENNIQSVGSGVLNLKRTTKRAYSAGTYVMKVFQYNNLNIQGGTNVTATTGIVYFYVKGTLTVNGTINVDGMGLAGGSGNPGQCDLGITDLGVVGIGGGVAVRNVGLTYGYWNSPTVGTIIDGNLAHCPTCFISGGMNGGGMGGAGGAGGGGRGAVGSQVGFYTCSSTYSGWQTYSGGTTPPVVTGTSSFPTDLYFGAGGGGGCGGDAGANGAAGGGGGQGISGTQGGNGTAGGVTTKGPAGGTGGTGGGIVVIHANTITGSGSINARGTAGTDGQNGPNGQSGGNGGNGSAGVGGVGGGGGGGGGNTSNAVSCGAGGGYGGAGGPVWLLRQTSGGTYTVNNSGGTGGQDGLYGTCTGVTPGAGGMGVDGGANGSIGINTCVPYGDWGLRGTCSGACGAGGALGSEGSDAFTATGFLPIELLDFTAKYNEQTGIVDLDWVTATETNNDYFTVEKTTDGENFVEVARVGGEGNSTYLNSYSAIDKDVYSGVTYYRLTQTDFDGKQEYFKMVSVDVKRSDDVRVFPNPVDHTERLMMQLNDKISSTNFSITMYNSLGQQLFTKNITREIENVTTLVLLEDLRVFTSGIYFITTTSSQERKTYSNKIVIR